MSKERAKTPLPTAQLGTRPAWGSGNGATWRLQQASEAAGGSYATRQQAAEQQKGRSITPPPGLGVQKSPAISPIPARFLTPRATRPAALSARSTPTASRHTSGQAQMPQVMTYRSPAMPGLPAARPGVVAAGTAPKALFGKLPIQEYRQGAVLPLMPPQLQAMLQLQTRDATFIPLVDDLEAQLMAEIATLNQQLEATNTVVDAHAVRRRHQPAQHYVAGSMGIRHQSVQGHAPVHGQARLNPAAASVHASSGHAAELARIQQLMQGLLPPVETLINPKSSSASGAMPSVASAGKEVVATPGSSGQRPTAADAHSGAQGHLQRTSMPDRMHLPQTPLQSTALSLYIASLQQRMSSHAQPQPAAVTAPPTGTASTTLSLPSQQQQPSISQQPGLNAAMPGLGFASIDKVVRSTSLTSRRGVSECNGALGSVSVAADGKHIASGSAAGQSKSSPADSSTGLADDGMSPGALLQVWQVLQASQANVDMLASDLQAARHDQHTAQEQHAAAEQRASTWQAQAAGAARQLQALQAQLADLAARETAWRQQLADAQQASARLSARAMQAERAASAARTHAARMTSQQEEQHAHTQGGRSTHTVEHQHLRQHIPQQAISTGHIHGHQSSAASVSSQCSHPNGVSPAGRAAVMAPGMPASAKLAQSLGASAVGVQKCLPDASHQAQASLLRAQVAAASARASKAELELALLRTRLSATQQDLLAAAERCARLDTRACKSTSEASRARAALELMGKDFDGLQAHLISLLVQARAAAVAAGQPFVQQGMLTSGYAPVLPGHTIQAASAASATARAGSAVPETLQAGTQCEERRGVGAQDQQASKVPSAKGDAGPMASNDAIKSYKRSDSTGVQLQRGPPQPVLARISSIASQSNSWTLASNMEPVPGLSPEALVRGVSCMSDQVLTASPRPSLTQMQDDTQPAGIPVLPQQQHSLPPPQRLPSKAWAEAADHGGHGIGGESASPEQAGAGDGLAGKRMLLTIASRSVTSHGTPARYSSRAGLQADAVADSRLSDMESDSNPPQALRSIATPAMQVWSPSGMEGRISGRAAGGQPNADTVERKHTAEEHLSKGHCRHTADTHSSTGVQRAHGHGDHYPQVPGAALSVPAQDMGTPLPPTMHARTDSSNRGWLRIAPQADIQPGSLEPAGPTHGSVPPSRPSSLHASNHGSRHILGTGPGAMLTGDSSRHTDSSLPPPWQRRLATAPAADCEGHVPLSMASLAALPAELLPLNRAASRTKGSSLRRSRTSTSIAFSLSSAGTNASLSSPRLLAGPRSLRKAPLRGGSDDSTGVAAAASALGVVRPAAGSLPQRQVSSSVAGVGVAASAGVGMGAVKHVGTLRPSSAVGSFAVPKAGTSPEGAASAHFEVSRTGTGRQQAVSTIAMLRPPVNDQDAAEHPLAPSSVMSAFQQEPPCSPTEPARPSESQWQEQQAADRPPTLRHLAVLQNFDSGDDVPLPQRSTSPDQKRHSNAEYEEQQSGSAIGAGCVDEVLQQQHMLPFSQVPVQSLAYSPTSAVRRHTAAWLAFEAGHGALPIHAALGSTDRAAAPGAASPLQFCKRKNASTVNNAIPHGVASGMLGASTRMTSPEHINSHIINVSDSHASLTSLASASDHPRQQVLSHGAHTWDPNTAASAALAAQKMCKLEAAVAQLHEHAPRIAPWARTSVAYISTGAAGSSLPVSVMEASKGVPGVAASAVVAPVPVASPAHPNAVRNLDAAFAAGAAHTGIVPTYPGHPGMPGMMQSGSVISPQLLDTNAAATGGVLVKEQGPRAKRLGQSAAGLRSALGSMLPWLRKKGNVQAAESIPCAVSNVRAAVAHSVEAAGGNYNAPHLTFSTLAQRMAVLGDRAERAKAPGEEPVPVPSPSAAGMSFAVSSTYKDTFFAGSGPYVPYPPNGFAPNDSIAADVFRQYLHTPSAMLVVPQPSSVWAQPAACKQDDELECSELWFPDTRPTSETSSPRHTHTLPSKVCMLPATHEGRGAQLPTALQAAQQAGVAAFPPAAAAFTDSFSHCAVQETQVVSPAKGGGARLQETLLRGAGVAVGMYTALALGMPVKTPRSVNGQEKRRS